MFNILNDMWCPRHIVALIHAVQLVPEDGSRKRGRPKRNGGSFQKDLKEMGVRMDGGYSSHEATRRTGGPKYK